MNSQTTEQTREPNPLSLQAGRQQQAGASPADIVIYGGAAGGGKSHWLLLEAARHFDNPLYVAKIFRKTHTQITGGGGLWDKSFQLYPMLGAKSNGTELSWKFPSGAHVGFAHCQHEKDKYNHQGKEYAFIGFDEADHFSWSQIWYICSRSRSICGTRPIIRMTCNPNPDHEIKPFISWWLDENGQFPDISKAGVLRWFVMKDDRALWHDTDPEEFWGYIKTIREKVDPVFSPKSVTFIPASVDDNPLLLKTNPGYKAMILSQPLIERQRLLYGDWLVRPAAGLYFKREWFNIAHRPPRPQDIKSIGRAWDLAGTKKTKIDTNDPDWTAGVLMCRTVNDDYYVLDVKRFRDTPGVVREMIRATAEADREQWGNVRTYYPQDPAQAGQDQALSYKRMMAGLNARPVKPSGSKTTRAEPFSAQCDPGASGVGNVFILNAPWNEVYLNELESFPDGPKDDQVDASSDIYNQLVNTKSMGRNWN